MNIRLPLAFLALLAIGAALLPGPSGFCYSEYSFLSQDEFIRRLMVQYNAARPKTVSVLLGDTAVIATLLPYKDVDQMIKENPDCCTVKKIIWGYNTHGEGRFDLSGWVFLNFSYYISGRIKNSFQLPDGSVIEKTNSIGDGSGILGSCGQLKD